MSHRVLALCSEVEHLAPSTSSTQGFFEALRDHGCRTEPAESPPTAAHLAGFESVLVGMPRWPLPRGLCHDLQAWTRAGGSLLLVGTMGGDVQVDGDQDGRPVNLGAIIPELDWPDVTLAGPSAAEPDDASALTPTVTIDLSPLLREPAELVYDRGGLVRANIACPADVAVTHSLAAPGSSQDKLLEGARFAEGSVVGDKLFTDQPLRRPEGTVLLRLRYGHGTVVAFAGGHSLDDGALAEPGNSRFLHWLIMHWLRRYSQEELRTRRRRAQRHRLLHGYPMHPAMTGAGRVDAPDVDAALSALGDAPRPLLVGVLPHPFCNPAVKGCGFCTFPHESFENQAAREVTRAVIREVEEYAEARSAPARGAVVGLYLGGATANLTPPDVFEQLCRALENAFDLRGAEVTLEGVPVYFRAARGRLLATLRETLSARHFRISMGVQTFDAAQLARMGRTAFGDLALVREVVRDAHAGGMTASGDFLFNLPGQTFAQMEDDLRRAVDAGFDHLGLYHLVLFEGLGTEWSNDRSLLAALPDNSRACNHWLRLREVLTAEGYVQTTLTNFERRDVHDSGRRFVYEPEGFAPERNDLLGFGPTAINLRCAPDLSRGVKYTNPDGASDYLRKQGERIRWDRAFNYDARDMRVLYLTRKIALLGFSRADYRAVFRTDPLEDFALEFEALIEHRVLTVTDDRCQLTPKGTFYADSVAGLLAQARLRWLGSRRKDSTHRFEWRSPRPVEGLAELDNYGHMG